MTTRTKTYRIDTGLDDAVVAKAASEKETVTDVIIRAFRAYTTETLPAPRPARGQARTPGPAAGSCTHRLPPGAYCKTCDRIT